MKHRLCVAPEFPKLRVPGIDSATTIKDREWLLCRNSRKSAIVTGGARGLGRAIAQMLVERGAQVAIIDLNGQAAAETADELRRSDGIVHDIAGDIRFRDGARAAVTTAAARLGALDILVNNAGVYPRKPLLEIDDQAWDHTFDVNLRGMYHVTCVAVPLMQARKGGRIVSIASIDAHIPYPKNAHYAAAKAGVISFTRSFAEACAADQILVNAVSPGPIATQQLRDLGILADLEKNAPLGRVAAPEDIAEVVCFLASSRNRFITGETIIASGGIVDGVKSEPREESVKQRQHLNRRSLLASAAGIAVVLPVMGFPTVLRAKPERMTIPNPGGALEEALKAAYFKTFTEKTGIEISGAPYADTAKIKAMVENNAVDTDVIFTDAADAAMLAKQGLLEPIDFSVVDKSVLIPEAVHEHYLADVAAYAMAWNTKSMSDDKRPKTWAEFFDPAAKPGQRSLWKYAAQTLEVAAMGAGQSRDKLYPLDLDAAFAKLDAVKGSLTWWDSGAQGRSSSSMARPMSGPCGMAGSTSHARTVPRSTTPSIIASMSATRSSSPRVPGTKPRQ